MSEIWQALNTALQKDPENASIHLDLSNVYLALNEIESAKQHLHQALRINPNYAEGYNNLGRLFYKQGLFKEAIPLFEKALRLYPNYFEAHYNLANSFSQLTQYDRALVHYQKAVSLQENHYDAQHNLGLVLFEAERYSEAEKHLRISWEATEYLASGLILGQDYLALGNVEEAKKIYEALLTKDSTLTEAQHNLGVIYLWAHEHDKALKQFETVLRYDPKNETAKHMRDALRGETQVNHPPTQYVKDLFDQYADHFDVHVKEQLHYQVPFHLRNALGKIFKEKLKTGRLLDLGCGTGISGIYFRDLATELVGIDVSPKMIEKAKALGAYDELHTMDILKYLRESTIDPFNFIIASDVFVYCGDLAPIFSAVVRHLVWGGIFALTTECLEVNGEREEAQSSSSVKKKNFSLQKTGRFAHSRDYILQLAHSHALSVALEETVVLRKNHDIDILGGLYILQRY